MSSSPTGSVAILDHFSALQDPRQQWRVSSGGCGIPCVRFFLLVLCATLSGMEDFVEPPLRGEQRLDFPRRLLRW